jgi:hypothetical protein
VHEQLHHLGIIEVSDEIRARAISPVDLRNLTRP